MKKICVMHRASIGDTLLATPVYRAIKTVYPDTKLVVVTSHLGDELLQGNPYIDKLIPYENAKSIKHTMEELRKLPDHGRIAVFIGPEGGFSDSEIEDALQHGIEPITLGKRILRTETAAITSLSVLMLMLEAKADEENL